MKLLSATIAVMLLLVAGAEGRTVVVDRPNMQAWVDASKVPTPDIEVTVQRADTKGVCERPNASGCWVAATNTIALRRHIGTRSREVFLHELGHAFDTYLLTDTDRVWFRFFFRRERRWGQTLGDLTPGLQEWFADTYEACAIGRFSWWEGISVGQDAFDALRVRRGCRKVRRIYRR